MEQPVLEPLNKYAEYAVERGVGEFIDPTFEGYRDAEARRWRGILPKIEREIEVLKDQIFSDRETLHDLEQRKAAILKFIEFLSA